MDYDEVVGIFQDLPSLEADEQFALAFMLLDELELGDHERKRLRELAERGEDDRCGAEGKLQ